VQALKHYYSCKEYNTYPTLGKYVKTLEATLKGTYTSYARICIEMDVFGALPEAISLEFMDEEWIQNIDYE
jgi:hypothetical protein